MTFLLAFLLSAVTPAAAGNRQMDDLEARLTQDPASLRVAAEYRQLVIDSGTYDRSLKLFERLAKDPRGGANRYVNLALATVDKVPIAGSFRRALLGRDAIDALSRAIAIEPTPLAYLVRGLVNLYYDQFIFHRTDKGVADLEIARRLSAAYPQVRYAPRILIPLGDGYWRLNQHDKAREVWREGQASCPDVDGFRLRLAARDDQIGEIIEHALDPAVRVDTTLREMFPDLTRTASKAVP
jgi:tetratricopeptide (TPR) repeat protein